MSETLDVPAAASPETAAPMTPAMTVAEQALLAEAARGRQRALEFGCGGSTALLLRCGLGRLTSIDSDPAWLARVGADPQCRAAVEDGRLALRHAAIGPTGAWGWPEHAGALHLWPGYWRDAWDQAGEVDFVLVDGRFRCACALAGVPRLAADALLLIHDFWPRPWYRAAVLRHYAVIGSAGSLALLRVRQPADAAMLAVDLAAHAFDPR